MTRIVLADDHAFLRAGVESVLAAQGMEIVASVGDGAAALAAIQANEPDLVILDARMPIMNGIEALQALRAQGDTRPVILLTAELSDPDLLDALKAKVDGIVFKQGAETRLEKAIAQALKGSRFIDLELMDRALALTYSTSAPTSIAVLSEREQEIARAVAEGKSNKEIAITIGTTEGTIKVYMNRIFEKLSIKNRTELAIIVINDT